MNGTKSLPYSDAEVRECLTRIVESDVFARADRQKKFLTYLVEHTLSGTAQGLKGYTIGIDVFNRPAAFDPAVDSIVRVHAAQLRAKLREYYAERGRGDRLCIDVPRGSYAVRILVREAEAAPTRNAEPVPSIAEGRVDTNAGRSGQERDMALGSQTLSIAVLPFANMSSDPEQGYFADGITDDLTTELSKLSGLLVISRHSAFVYRNTTKSAEEVGRDLGVRYLLEGSVRRTSSQVRISARLVDVELGGQIWAERYDRAIENVFDVQDDVTRRIIGVLRVKLVPAEADRIGVAGTRSIAAYEKLLRAREQTFRFTCRTNEAARAHCRAAIAIDPGYAAAHAELARTFVCEWIMDWTNDPAVLDTALGHAQRATELDPQLALGHALVGFVQLWRKQGEAAIAEGERAIHLDPNDADARAFLSCSLASCNRPKEALFHIEIALRLHPYRPAHYLYTLGLCHYLLYDYGKAIAVLEQAVASNPSFVPHQSLLVKLYTFTGRHQDARRARDVVLAAGGRGSFPTTFYIDPELAERAERDRRLAWDQ